MQLRAAIDGFLRFCASERQLSRHTVQAYTADLADFRKWLVKDQALADVVENTLKEYLAHMVSERKLATATVRRRFACLQAFFRHAADGHQSVREEKLLHELVREGRFERQHLYAELGEIVNGSKKAREGNEKIYLNAMGLGIEDISVAAAVYSAYIGEKIDLS